jgi:predicted alpha/beta hydrolase family esterase
MSADLRLVVVPRWGGDAGSDFYPWLFGQPTLQSAFAEVEVVTLPRPDAPPVDETVRAVLAALGDDARRLERTVVMGHSVGFQAVLRALERLRPPARVRAALGVAGWWTVDRPWPTIVPWVEAPIDDAHVRAAAGRIVVLLSDDDPFTADAGATRRAFEARLGAEVVVHPGARHFNEKAEPAVLAALTRLAGEGAPA